MQTKQLMHCLALLMQVAFKQQEALTQLLPRTQASTRNYICHPAPASRPAPDPGPLATRCSYYHVSGVLCMPWARCRDGDAAFRHSSWQFCGHGVQLGAFCTGRMNAV
jgi:hypothetical protein